MKISMPTNRRPATSAPVTGAPDTKVPLTKAPVTKVPGFAAAATRIVHLHIPKTAGNSFKSAMEQCSTRKMRIFPHWHEEEYHSFQPQDYDFYSGHIGYNTAHKIGGDIISVFRNPVDRFISVYYFWRYLHETNIEVRQATIIASKYSLDEFVKIKDVVALSEELNNRMTFQTAFGSSRKHREELRTEGKTEDDIFRTAIRNVGTFPVIGVQENLKEFEANIRYRYGVELNIQTINQNEDSVAIEDISFSTKSRILEWTYMDMELYQRVVQMCRERAEAARADPIRHALLAREGR